MATKPKTMKVASLAELLTESIAVLRYTMEIYMTQKGMERMKFPNQTHQKSERVERPVNSA